MGNMIKAVVGKNAKKIRTAPLYQYDYGQILKIEGIELPTAYQVHFSNDPMGSSTTSIGNSDGVAIPDTYLTSGDAVYAWLYLHTGEDDGETVLMIEIPVNRRAEITNETPSTSEQSEIDQLINELNAAVDDAEDSAEDAADSAEDAEAWAAGTRGGEAVESTDPAYHNNAKYYAEQEHRYDPDVKIDKVTTATSGNFASFDNEGGLQDSGKKDSDFLTQHQDISGKANLTVAAPAFAEATANDAGSFVTYEGVVYLLPDGHTANTTWANTTKTATNLGDQLAAVKNALDGVDNKVESISEVHISKNLYDKSSCNPADGKSYWEGSRITAATYATTGKIPVEESTQYIFSAGSAPIKYVEFYSGDTGSTFISKLTIDGAAFTTPENCTYISVMLFGISHTTDQYNAAMAVAELNKGATAQPYEPYGSYRIVPLDVVEDGDKISGISGATDIQSQANLYDKRLAVDGASVYENQINTGASFAKYAFTGFIPVKPNTQYCLSRDTLTPIQFITKVWEYNASRSYVGYIQNELAPYNANYSITFVTGATTYFIAVNMELASHTTQNFNDTINSIMLVYGTQRPLTYSAYNEETVVLAKCISNAFFSNADAFNSKKWLALGTSITWYDSHKFQSGLHTDDICRGYVGNVARRKSGLIVKNGGIAGSTLANVDTNSLINRYQSIDWTSYDFVTIEFGVNDMGNDIAVGTASDAAGNTTFASCLKTVIEYAMAQNHKICIIICTEPDVRGTNTNNNGNTLKDYTDVTLAIAELYRLPVCDWYYHSGINNWNRGNASYDYLTADGTHPNNDGHNRMGAMLNQVFDGMMC